MKASSVFALLTTPLLPWVAMHLWIQSNIQEWAESGSSVPGVTRTLMAIDLFVVRYSAPTIVITMAAAPLMAAALATFLRPVEVVDRPNEHVSSVLRSFGRWLVAAVVLGGLELSIVMVSGAGRFGLFTVLGWTGSVALILALAHGYLWQQLRQRSGRSGWHWGWLVGVSTVLHLLVFPFGSFVFGGTLYLYGRYDSSREGRSLGPGPRQGVAPEGADNEESQPGAPSPRPRETL